MTREDIEKAAKQAGFYAFSDMEVVEFALEMVRQHNEELEERIKRICVHTGFLPRLLKELRGIKP